LNHFTEVRRWLKEEKRYEEWQNLEVQWISHHDPILRVLDDSGEEKESIDLTEYSYAQLPEMLRAKGFKMQGEL